MNYPRTKSFQDPAELESHLAWCESIQRARRDQFAAAALTGLLAYSGKHEYKLHETAMAECARAAADALIAELDK
jgi:hypothetical protein